MLFPEQSYGKRNATMDFKSSTFRDLDELPPSYEPINYHYNNKTYFSLGNEFYQLHPLEDMGCVLEIMPQNFEPVMSSKDMFKLEFNEGDEIFYHEDKLFVTNSGRTFQVLQSVNNELYGKEITGKPLLVLIRAKREKSKIIAASIEEGQRQQAIPIIEQSIQDDVSFPEPLDSRESSIGPTQNKGRPKRDSVNSSLQKDQNSDSLETSSDDDDLEALSNGTSIKGPRRCFGRQNKLPEGRVKSSLSHKSAVEHTPFKQKQGGLNNTTPLTASKRGRPKLVQTTPFNEGERTFNSEVAVDNEEPMIPVKRGRGRPRTNLSTILQSTPRANATLSGEPHNANLPSALKHPVDKPKSNDQSDFVTRDIFQATPSSDNHFAGSIPKVKRGRPKTKSSVSHFKTPQQIPAFNDSSSVTPKRGRGRPRINLISPSVNDNSLQLGGNFSGGIQKHKPGPILNRGGVSVSNFRNTARKSLHSTNSYLQRRDHVLGKQHSNRNSEENFRPQQVSTALDTPKRPALNRSTNPNAFRNNMPPRSFNNKPHGNSTRGVFDSKENMGQVSNTPNASNSLHSSQPQLRSSTSNPYSRKNIHPRSFDNTQPSISTNAPNSFHQGNPQSQSTNPNGFKINRLPNFYNKPPLNESLGELFDEADSDEIEMEPVPFSRKRFEQNMPEAQWEEAASKDMKQHNFNRFQSKGVPTPMVNRGRNIPDWSSSAGPAIQETKPKVQPFIVKLSKTQNTKL